MKTLKKLDKRALIAVITVLTVLMLTTLAACAMQKASAEEELSAAPAMETESVGQDADADVAESDDDSTSPSEDQTTTEGAASETSPLTDKGADDTTSSSASASNNAPSGGSSSNQVRASGKHEHSWEPILDSQKVIDKYAYTETLYRTEECLICKFCGADVTKQDEYGRNSTEHGKAHTLAGEDAGCYSSTKRVPCGVIEHEEESHYENIVIGYKCSCGATKQ